MEGTKKSNVGCTIDRYREERQREYNHENRYEPYNSDNKEKAQEYVELLIKNFVNNLDTYEKAHKGKLNFSHSVTLTGGRIVNISVKVEDK